MFFPGTTDTNSAAILTGTADIELDADTIANNSGFLSALGLQGDSAWDGIAANAGAIAILKKMVANQAGPYSVVQSPAYQLASKDGLPYSTTILEMIIGAYLSGGQLDVSGKPTQLSFDRVRTIQGKGIVGATANIVATVSGDTQIVFNAAPKTIMPGQALLLAVGAGGFTETVYVDTSYVVSSSATTIPLASPVVAADLTTAKWDIYTTGVNYGNMLPTGILPVAPVVLDSAGGSTFRLVFASSGDALNSNNIMAIGNMLYNGSTYDRQRNNLDNIIIGASAARTTTFTSADQTNHNGRGVLVVVDVTALTATGTLTPEIDFKDPVSGKYVSLLTSSVAIAAIGTYAYLVYPGTSTSVANTGITQSSDMVIPRTWRTVVTPGNGVSITYSVGAMVIA